MIWSHAFLQGADPSIAPPVDSRHRDVYNLRVLMRIDEILGRGQPTVSFEFFPPKNEQGFTQLYQTIEDLKPISPSYVSVTYGAGGSTRQKTVGLVEKIQNEIG